MSAQLPLSQRVRRKQILHVKLQPHQLTQKPPLSTSHSNLCQLDLGQGARRRLSCIDANAASNIPAVASSRLCLQELRPYHEPASLAVLHRLCRPSVEQAVPA